jgi:hypothetical protein
MMTLENEPRGLGGWLVLVAIGLIVTVVRVCMLLFGTYVPLFTRGSWTALTTETSRAYHPLWRPLLLFEGFGNVVILLAALLALGLFFSRAPNFPPLMIGFYLFNVLFIATDHFVGQRIPAVASARDSKSGGEIVRSVVACSIWVPYMLKSRRVRNTFLAPRVPLLVPAPVPTEVILKSEEGA